MKLPVYLDYMATTPVDPRVKEKMCACLTMDGNFGNPASSSHVYGSRAKEAVELARAQVADLINAEPQEIIWTSGATEANNLKKDTILVSIMQVNNEIGVIQDIKAIAELVKPHGVIFHVDAVQAAGKIPVDVKALPVDLMSFSAHKAYGPKGVGFLYIRRKPRVHLEAQIHGGGHEFGIRSGTLAPHQIVGMGEAFAICKQEMDSDCKRIAKLRDKLWRGIKSLGDIYQNGDLKKRVANNLNVSFGGIRGADLVGALKDVAISTSSACISASHEPSYALKAIGVSNALALSSVRFSLGRFTTEPEIDYTIEHVKQAINKLRGKS